MYKARNILFILLCSLVIWGCKEDVKHFVKSPKNAEKVPSVLTTNVRTLISDSGITQYRITAKIWGIYMQAKRPYWSFPKGLYLEQFDSVFKTAASIRCDSATYYKDEQIWQLDGHVTILNAKKEVILTPQLFWNQRQQKVYSDSFIHIEKSDRILEGYGFESNEKMTVYMLKKPEGIFPVEQFKARKDTANRSVIDK